MSKNCDYSLPEVIEVRALRCRDLPAAVMQSHVAGVQLFISAPMRTLNIYPGTTCEGVINRNNGGVTQRTTLVFKTCDELEPVLDLGFAVCTPKNDWYLIGAKEKPYPQIEISDNLGTTLGEQAVKTVKVTFESLCTLIPVSIVI